MSEGGRELDVSWPSFELFQATYKRTEAVWDFEVGSLRLMQAFLKSHIQSAFP